jgi:lipopolysaccharide export system permease protein
VRTLHNYLTRQILAAMLMTVVVFTFVLLLGNVLKEILAMLVNRQATLFLAGQAIGLLIPFVLVFALPMGLLTATLLVFGRFSADHELTAVRASGVSLVALISPILLVSAVMAGISGWINLQIAPQCRVAYKRLLVNVGVAQTGLLLPEKTFIKDFPNRIVYIGEINGPFLKDVLLYNLDSDDKVEYYIRAGQGRLTTDKKSQVITVQLFDAWRVGMMEGNEVPVPVYAAESTLSYTNQPNQRKEEKTQITDMTFRELRDELRQLERRMRFVPPAKLPRDQVQKKFQNFRENQEDLTLPIRLQIHSKVAFSFASIGFTLVGIPLGIRAHRRETTFGIAIALILVLVYYSFFILAQSLDTRPEYFPHLIIWIPNFLFQAIGAVLLWRANRGI